MKLTFTEKFLVLLVFGSLLWNVGLYLNFQKYTEELTRQNKIYAEYFQVMTEAVEEAHARYEAQKKVK